MSEVLLTYPDGPDGDWVVITLNRPAALNSLNRATLTQLGQAAREVAAQPLKVVVLRGNGRAFCAGADFALLQGQEGPPFEIGELGRTTTEAIESIPAVTVAVLHGPVIGGGVVLAACCDLRVAAHDTFFSIPEIDVGLPLGWAGVPRLVREMGPALARELVMTCRPFTADEANQTGFVNRVAPANQLDEVAQELVETLRAKPAFALLSAKQAIAQVVEQMAPSFGRMVDSREQAQAYQNATAQQAMQDYLARLAQKNQP